MLAKDTCIVCIQVCIWVFDRACGISFIYSKNNKGLNIDPWGTRQFMAPVSQITVSNETKKAPFVRKEWNHFIVLLEKPIDFISSNKILWFKVLRAFSRSIKIIPVCFQHRLKSCQSCETYTCGMICSKTCLYSSSFFLTQSCVWYGPSILKATEK